MDVRRFQACILTFLNWNTFPYLSISSLFFHEFGSHTLYFSWLEVPTIETVVGELEETTQALLRAQSQSSEAILWEVRVKQMIDRLSRMLVTTGSSTLLCLGS